MNTQPATPEELAEFENQYESMFSIRSRHLGKFLKDDYGEYLMPETHTAFRIWLPEYRKRKELQAEIEFLQTHEGWKLVPMNPTDTMLGAALRHIHGMACVPAAYRAMLNAAPEPSK